MELSERKFGCHRQKYDPRDKKFLDLVGPQMLEMAIPQTVDMRPHCPPVYDQGALGSCTANAIAFICEHALMTSKHPREWVPSRKFQYYNELAIDGNLPNDDGSTNRTGLQVVHKFGFTSETLCPYDIPHFAVKPSPAAYASALKERVKDYGAVDQQNDAMKTALAMGYPIVIGFIVYESFMTQAVAQTGIVPMPGPNERAMGGHAVAIVGYNSQGWIVRNSWGANWGQAGYFIMPYQYFTNPQIAFDLWVVRVVP